MVNLEDLKKEAAAILKDEKVKYIIGYQKNSNGLMPSPVFIKKPEDVERLIWNPACVHNLTRFLVDEKRRKAREKHPDERPVGIIVKGCDSRALVVLLQEKFINREDIYIIGVSCESAGVVDEKPPLCRSLSCRPLVRQVESPRMRSAACSWLPCYLRSRAANGTFVSPMKSHGVPCPPGSG